MPWIWEVLSKDMISTASKAEAPLVSIVVPIFNVGPFVLPCIRSLLCQTYPNIEILIVDDGCTDDTVELIASVVGMIHASRFSTRRTAGSHLPEIMALGFVTVTT